MGRETERGPAEVGRGWLTQGTEALERGHIPEAIENLRRAVEADPHSLEAYLHLGIALVMDAQVYEAIDTFEAALALSPHDFMINLKLAELYLKLCVPEKGHTYLRAARDASSTSEERQLVRALMSQEADREKRRIYRPTFGKP